MFNQGGIMKKLIMLLVICGAVLAGCGEDPPPRSVQEISSRIKTVSEDGSVLKIELAPQAALRAKDHFQNASMDMARITEKIIQYFPGKQQEKLVYVLWVDAVDKFGNEAKEPALEIEYSMADMRKVNFANMYHKQLLQLAKPVSYRGMVGVEVVRTWCADEGNREDAKAFCAKNT